MPPQTSYNDYASSISILSNIHTVKYQGMLLEIVTTTPYEVLTSGGTKEQWAREIQGIVW